MNVIDVKSIYKEYELTNDKDYDSLRDKIAKKIKNIWNFKSFFSLRKKEKFYALKNINFKVEKGEILGIIGPNGAGKSTLLKILSRITLPTSGKVFVQGRLSSLLEVGTGFHPELTGRENIFLNGAILGISRENINKKFDEIVEFSGVSKFLDLPAKHYSSGMLVRLAFSVAAHIEPDILLIDEVLAVGDAEFQRKCIGKIEEVTHKSGRTVLFVSHNMDAVRNICRKCILLEHGEIALYDETSKVVDEYLCGLRKTVNNSDISLLPRSQGLGELIKITNARLFNFNDNNVSQLFFGEPFAISIEIRSSIKFEKISVGFRIESISGLVITGPFSDDSMQFFDCLPDKPLILKVKLRNFKLTPGFYFLTFTIRQNKTGLDQVIRAINFEVLNVPYENHRMHSGSWGYVHIEPDWKNLSI